MQGRIFAILAAGLLPTLVAAPAFAAPTGTADRADAAAESRAALRALVTASTAPSAVANPPGPAAAPAKATEAARLPPPCTRKVKVVYAGYGEADRAACTVSPSPGG